VVDAVVVDVVVVVGDAHGKRHWRITESK